MAVHTLQRWPPFTRGREWIRKFPVSSQTLSRGEVVKLSSGSLVRVESAGTDIDGDDLIAGFLLHDVVATDTEAYILVAHPGCEFALPVNHDTAASAITATTQYGSEFEMANATGNIPVVAIDNTTKPVGVVTGIFTGLGMAVGDQHGLVWFRILDDVCQLVGNG